MDNFIVSARKYRPATFNTVVGQTAITNTLKNAIKNQQLAQAFLFTGPRGVGKTTCARILAKTINCTAITPEGEACNTCASCQIFNKSSSFNIFELDAASNSSVDDIRTLIDQVRIPPQQGYKVYIIDEVHMLSPQAFNAFLKTLEEPPAYAKFILATTEKHKIMPTILSRCQIFDFRRISVEDIAHHLDFVAHSEHIDAEPEALHIIAQKADGGLRDALSMFDQLVSYAGNKLTYKQVIENLNVLDYDYYFKITDFILAGDVSHCLLTINEIIENGFEGQHFITGLGEHLRNLLVSKDRATLQLLETTGSVKEQYKVQSDRCSVQFLLEALRINNEIDINYKTSNNKKLYLEIGLMQLCRLSIPVTHLPVPKASTPSPKTPPTQSPATQSPAPQSPAPQASVPQTSAPQAQAPQTSLPQTSQVPTSNASAPVDSISKNSVSPNSVSQQQPKPASSTQPGVHAEKGSLVNESGQAYRAENKTKPVATFSGLNLAGLMTGKKPSQADQSAEEQEEAPGESFGNEPVSQGSLMKVWSAMVESLSEELPLLQNTLLWKAPELLENSGIRVFIENTLQQDEIYKNRGEITLYLRKALKNDALFIETQIVESVDGERKPYTDTEKYEYVVKKAPAVRDLKEQMGLELEM